MHSCFSHTVLSLILILAPTPLLTSEGVDYRPPEFGPPGDRGHASRYHQPKNNILPKRFCDHAEASGKSASYCEVKYDQTNKTINAQVTALTTTPTLATYPYTLDKLPEPLLPLGSELGLFEKGGLEWLYTLAMNKTLADRNPDAPWQYKRDEEEAWQAVKNAYWARLWCNEATDTCVPWEDWKGKAHVDDENEVKEKLTRGMEKKGLFILGDRLLEFLSKPENQDVKKLCTRSAYYKADQCDKNGENCKLEAWTQLAVECPIDCGKQACLRVADGNYIG